MRKIVNCIKEKSKHQNNISTSLDVSMNVKKKKMHVEKIVDLLFMWIINLAQVALKVFINLILMNNKS